MPAPDFDWPRLWFEAIGSALSAITGVVFGIWRWGRNSALAEQAVRDDYMARIDVMKAALAKSEELQKVRLDDLVDQFKEYFAGLRRQIDEDRLRLEQNFVRRDDFKEMREEIREDMREIKRSIGEIRK